MDRLIASVSSLVSSFSSSLSSQSSSPDGGLAANTTLAVIFVTVVVAVYFLNSRRNGYVRWEKYGVKHVDVRLREVPILMLHDLMKNHGPTVGIMRDIPQLVTRDLDLLKQILVKDFNNFVNRNDAMATRSPLGRGVFFLRDYDWKRIRQLMSPSFSTGKLKRISAHVQEAAHSLSKAFQKCAHTGTNIKVIHVTGQYSTSIIAKTAFGMQADSIGEEEDDQFTHCAKNIFKTRSKLSYFFIQFLIRFRAFRKYLVYTFGLHFADPCTKSSADYFSAVLKEAIKEREVAEKKGSHHRHNDFLQSLVSTKVATDATAEEAPSGSAQTDGENGPAKIVKRITADEVIGQSVLTILAAFETTASTLHFCLFKLAENPDIQEKVFLEIQEVVQHEEPTHEELSSLPYLEQVINETLRLFPPLPAISRRAYESRTYGSVTIPAGAAVSIPIREIHRDPANYPDPDTFDPDRFTEENKAKRNPLAFMPFGQGPRLCIGMRLAYLELRLALVQILRKVRLELNEKTEPRKGEDITMSYRAFPRPVKSILLAVKLRDEQC